MVQVSAYPEMMFGQGLIDSAQREIIQSYCDRTIAFILEGNMTAAFDVWDIMLNGDVFPYPNLFHNMTGSNDYDNLMNTNAPRSFGYYSKCACHATSLCQPHLSYATRRCPLAQMSISPKCAK